MAAERSDTLIADEVVHTLGQHSQSSQVLVQVKDGTVTLSGDVPDTTAKLDIEKLIAGIQGVRDVRSHLHVDSGNSSFGARGEAVRDNPDGRDDAQMGDIDLDKDG
ncbi:BON domain-containing protein [Stenotrophomonas sp. Iso1]|uniref:BON domain-containing protein n=1 Tax=Stenotrophomonas sp. Iso1 TaxID=2977283 RepID=UPI0022B7A539|nr:BON domain-containing protein [Stenotrophomonas sp. Iso1]